MTAIPRAPSELTLEHTVDEHSEVRAQISDLRARGLHALADRIERAYTSTERLKGGPFARPLPGGARARERRR